MKYLQEKRLVKQVMQARLGYSPCLEDIIPLESTHEYGVCKSVYFYVKGNETVYYSANSKGFLMITGKTGEIILAE